MLRIALASANPVKIEATRRGFQRFFPDQEIHIQTTAVPSGVRDQPLSSAETLQGALNRARGALERVPDVGYGVGIEGGVEEMEGGLAAYAWIVVASREQLGKARTGTFFLPPRVAALVAEGKELGDADDIVFGRVNSKQDNGAVGILTGNVIDRTELYTQAVVLALIPFRNPELYSRTVGE